MLVKLTPGSRNWQLIYPNCKTVFLNFSWAQIMSLEPSYSGIYHCIASNSEGKVYAIASVGVYKNDL
jgi:hypothetical protein